MGVVLFSGWCSVMLLQPTPTPTFYFLVMALVVQGFCNPSKEGVSSVLQAL